MKDPAASSWVSSYVLRGHSGLDPESSGLSWTPAFAGVTKRGKPRGIDPKRLKRCYHFVRMRYKGLAKGNMELILNSMAFNLKKAAVMVE